MYAAKVSTNFVHVINIQSGSIIRTLPVMGAVSADVSGEFVSVTDKHGRVKVFNIKTGSIVRSF